MGKRLGHPSTVVGAASGGGGDGRGSSLKQLINLRSTGAVGRRARLARATVASV
jgi:hypothetical protein